MGEKEVYNCHNCNTRTWDFQDRLAKQATTSCDEKMKTKQATTYVMKDENGLHDINCILVFRSAPVRSLTMLHLNLCPRLQYQYPPPHKVPDLQIKMAIEWEIVVLPEISTLRPSSRKNLQEFRSHFLSPFGFGGNKLWKVTHPSPPNNPEIPTTRKLFTRIDTKIAILNRFWRFLAEIVRADLLFSLV